MTGPWLAVAAAFALVALNGFFVATEFALVKVRPTRLDELARRGSGAARRTRRLVGRRAAADRIEARERVRDDSHRRGAPADCRQHAVGEGRIAPARRRRAHPAVAATRCPRPDGAAAGHRVLQARPDAGRTPRDRPQALA